MNNDLANTFEPTAADVLQTVTGKTPDQIQSILAEAGSLRQLARMDPTQAAALEGSDETTAQLIQAMSRWAILLQRTHIDERTKLSTPEAVYRDFGLELSLLEQMQLTVLIVDGQNRLIK